MNVGPQITKYGTATANATAGATPLQLVLYKADLSGFASSSDWTPAAGDVKVSLAGGALANIATLPTYDDNTGCWTFVLSAAETQVRFLHIYVIDAAIARMVIEVRTEGHASAYYPPAYSAGSAGAILTAGTGTGQVNPTGGSVTVYGTVSLGSDVRIFGTITGTSPGSLVWAQSTPYGVGDVVSDPSDPDRVQRWQCAVAHTSSTVGEWDSGTTYPANSIVTYGGSVYVASVENTSYVPDSNPDKWLLSSSIFAAEIGVRTSEWVQVSNIGTLIPLQSGGDYVGRPVVISAGTGVGQATRITAMSGWTATVHPPLDTAVMPDSVYEILPIVIPELSALGRAVAVASAADQSIADATAAQASIAQMASRLDAAVSTRATAATAAAAILVTPAQKIVTNAQGQVETSNPTTIETTNIDVQSTEIRS